MAVRESTANTELPYEIAHISRLYANKYILPCGYKFIYPYITHRAYNSLTYG